MSSRSSSRRLSAQPGLEDIALTTNGVLLQDLAAPLRAAGLGRVTVSLDTLSRERFRELTRRDEHLRVLAGIAAVHAAGWKGLKLDCVVMRGRNDDELLSLLAYAKEQGAELRFIEYMDVGGATRWKREDVVSRAEMLQHITSAHGPVEALVEDGLPEPLRFRGRAPAERFRLGDGTTFGIIASTTAPFCKSCDRSRVTADGTWFLCLYARSGLNLREALRGGARTRRCESSSASRGGGGRTAVLSSASRCSTGRPWPRWPSSATTPAWKCTPAAAEAPLLAPRVALQPSPTQALCQAPGRVRAHSSGLPARAG